jgi:two-component system CheB/CheR fusion protein
MGRMQSLARAYDLVSREGWRKVGIMELVKTQLEPFAAERNRYSVAGEQVLLTANAALALGLVLYELATNATKYGALSAAEGRIEIAWRIESRIGSTPMLVFQWQERDGPKVEEPSRRGFGSELLQRQLRYELNGETRMDFHSDGLHATLEIPVNDAIVS